MSRAQIYSEFMSGSLHSPKVQQENRQARALMHHYDGSRPWRSIASICKPCWKPLALAWFYYPIKHAPIWTVPYITGMIIDILSKPEPSQHVTALTWLLVGGGLVVLLHVPMHVLFVHLHSSARRGVEKSLRYALIYQLQRLSIDFHQQQRSGRLYSKILRDVEQATQLLNMFYGPILGTFYGLLIAIIASVSTAPYMAIFFMLACPVAAVVIGLFRTRLKKANRHYRQRTEGMGGELSIMLQMLPFTRLHGLESKMLDDSSELMEGIRQSGRKLDLVTQTFGSSTWSAIQLSQLVFLAFGAWMVMTGQMSIGQLVMLVAYFAMVIQSAGQLLQSFPNVVLGMESVRSIGEVLDHGDIDEKEHGRCVNELKGKIEFQQVNYSYPGAGRLAVDDANITIQAGECVGVVGASGSGKSTLVAMLLGLRRPDEGQILIDGQDLAKINLPSLRQQVAVVSQEIVVFNGSLRENITYGMEDVPEEWIEACLASAQLGSLLERLPKGLDTEIGENGSQLSGGERQRVAIARALVRKPKLIILDEATAALDSQTEQEVQQAIHALVENHTTIMIAHRFATLKEAHRILVMNQGRVVQEGTEQELLAEPGIFRDLYEAQQLGD